MAIKKRAKQKEEPRAGDIEWCRNLLIHNIKLLKKTEQMVITYDGKAANVVMMKSPKETCKIGNLRL